jgi:hypothetical protein
MILPVNYEVPPEVMAKLVTGELQRFGSVVRDHTEIILHLKEVAVPVTEEGVASALKAVVSRSPKTSLGVGVALVAAGGAVLWSANKKRKGKNGTADIPKEVSAFTEALADYLEAVQSGNLDADIIERIISAVDALAAEATSGTPTVEVSTDHLTALVTLVDDYTCQLARANDVELDEVEQPVADLSIVDLRRRLESQQRVFKEAA